MGIFFSCLTKDLQYLGSRKQQTVPLSTCEGKFLKQQYNDMTITSDVLENVGTIKLAYIPTEDNVANIFTKPATKTKLEKFKQLIMGK